MGQQESHLKDQAPTNMVPACDNANALEMRDYEPRVLRNRATSESLSPASGTKGPLRSKWLALELAAGLSILSHGAGFEDVIDVRTKVSESH